MLLSLDRLKVFYHVFARGSVIAAAKKLHVSQSAVSQSLQKLETEIKSPLFTRLHKQLVPTASGERLFAVVRPFMVNLDTCLKTLEKSKDQPFGELRIGAPVEFGKAYLPAIVASFRKQYPDVSFHLKLGNPGTVLPMLKKGQIDVALVDTFQTQDQYVVGHDIYHFQPVAEEKITLACSRQYYAKSIKKDHSFKHLIRQNFIAYRQDAQNIRSWFKHHFKKSTIGLESALTVDSHQAVVSAIQHHMGMGIISSHIVSKEIQQGSIIGIKTSKSEIRNQISLTQLQDKIPTLTEKTFINFLLQEIELMGLLIKGRKSGLKGG
jgi:DNA-binding transcriptional LysR family regulator